MPSASGRDCVRMMRFDQFLSILIGFSIAAARCKFGRIALGKSNLTMPSIMFFFEFSRLFLFERIPLASRLSL